MKKLLALSIAHGLILSVASCSFDVVKPLFDNENNKVGAINCTKQKLLIKDSIEPMPSFDYKTGKWLTAGQHQIEVNKSGIKSFQGAFASMLVSDMLTKYCD